jgi:hypothetical protein
MNLVESLKPASRNVAKEALLKSLDQNLFIKCDAQFRNKLKAAVTALSNVPVAVSPPPGDVSTSAKSTPVVGKSNSLLLKSPESATKTESILCKRKEKEEDSFKDHLMEIDELLGESPTKQLPV